MGFSTGLILWQQISRFYQRMETSNTLARLYSFSSQRDRLISKYALVYPNPGIV
ncbi:hypothetical protein [Nostoc sp.]|uniref:hypothetical protein n=1 Tax=Nostoc sp. TaxID=1180 RepID=UPI002FF5A04E